MPYETDADGNIVANILPFATEAKTRLYEWQRMNTEECNREECDALKGVYNKFASISLQKVSAGSSPRSMRARFFSHSPVMATSAMRIVFTTE